MTDNKIRALVAEHLFGLPHICIKKNGVYYGCNESSRGLVPHYVDDWNETAQVIAWLLGNKYKLSVSTLKSGEHKVVVSKMFRVKKTGKLTQRATKIITKDPLPRAICRVVLCAYGVKA